MSVELNDPCPCGSTKKVKFCCGKAVSADLEKVAKSLEGEQFMAASERLDSLMGEHGDLPCLLALKGLALISSGQVEQAADNATRFCEVDPENATAWAQQALADDDALSSMNALQKSLEFADPTQLAPITLPALQLVTDRLFQDGNAFAGYWHLSLQMAFQRNDQSTVLQQMLPITQSQSIPLLLKQQLRIGETPEQADWKDDYQQALDFSGRGAWAASRELIRGIDSDDPLLLHAEACLSTFLGDSHDGPAAWRRYAVSCETDSDAAIESEAYAQLLQNQLEPDSVDLVTLTYPVENAETLQEHLISNPQAQFVPDVNWPDADAENPPPRAAFLLIDREQQQLAEDATPDQVPQAIAAAYLFGRQTDREARIECALVHAGSEEQDQQLIEGLLEDLAGELTSSEATRQAGAINDALNWHPAWPEETPPETVERLSVAHRDTALREIWPKIPLHVLGDQSAVAVVDTEEGRLGVQAALLLMETNMQAIDPTIDLSALREWLQLPAPTTIDPATIDIGQYPDIRFARLDATQLTLEQLTTVYSRSVYLGNSRAVILAAEEVISREEKPENISLAEVYGSLLPTKQTNQERLELMTKAQQAATSQGLSPAIWLLRELPLQLMEGNSNRGREIIEKIQADHLQEPGIQDQFYTLLTQLGLIQPQGMPGMPGMPPAAAAGPAVGGNVAAAGQPPAAGEVWTPQSNPSPPPQDDDKPSLWVPGMD